MALALTTMMLLGAVSPSSLAQNSKKSSGIDASQLASVLQTDFSLREAIAYGAAHNPGLAAARERVSAVRARLSSARSFEPPLVNVGPTIGGESATPILTQKFEISGRRQALTSIASSELRSTQLLYDAAERDLTREIESAYAGLVEARSTLEVANDMVGVIRRIRDSIKKQVAVGQLPTQDAVKADIELTRAELESFRAQNGVDRRRFEFNEALGRSAELPANPSEPTRFTPLTADLEKITSEALLVRPEIAAAIANVNAAKASVSLQRSELRPDLNLSLLANTNLKSNEFMRPNSTGLGLTLSFPLFDTGRIRGKVREAESEVRVLEYEVQASKLRVSQEVSDAFSRVRTTETLLVRYQQEILPSAKSLLAKAEFGYGRGGLTLLEFLESQRTYKTTQLEFLASLAENAKARADLDRAVGRRLAR